MVHFPEEIIGEILIRLPAKSLVRFHCVSKSWNANLTSQLFVKSHLDRSLRCRSIKLLRYERGGFPRIGIWSGGSDEFCRFDPQFQPSIGNFQLVGSCNGVICLSTLSRGNCSASDIYLWNPSINEFMALPQPGCPVSAAIGFGINPYSGHLDDIKVISIRNRYSCGSEFRSPRSSSGDSLRGNSWKQIETALPSWYSYYLGRQVMYKEFICWCANPREDHRSTWLLVSFDVINEVFTEMMLPENIAFSEKSITTIEGCISVSGHESYRIYEVWIMKEFGIPKSWTQLYLIKLPEYSPMHYELLGSAGAGELVFFILGLHSQTNLSYIGSYDLESKQFNQCIELDASSASGSCLVDYVTSLVSVLPKYTAECSHSVRANKLIG
ncbi:hypothetical protein BT93_L0810 [Corymbia citriodora subsp. variegata]|uniref:F-box domain-containing protein n=1 Tax=Corymbia citriodora subsp. variegata TaxID=360336 RepID=A0A8T0CP61_CORYI|nr:hypothetical protein BT93_L0810 [Corymbia citriodora subsp. variegata]